MSRAGPRIAGLEVIRSHVPGLAARDVALVVARDADGHLGVGEAAPLPGWSADDIEGVLEALHAARPSIDGIDETAPALASVDRALAASERALAACPTARFALETALLDLLARRRGADVARAIAGRPAGPITARAAGSIAAPPTAGAPPVDAVETSALLTDPADVDAFVARGLAALASGSRALKVKLRASDDAALAREIEGLAALRRAAPDFELRLDPNGRWSIDDARRRLAMLAPLAPRFVEQPVPAAALSELGPCAAPWAADESLAHLDVALRLSPEGGCAAFVLKPAALGIGRARRLASLARERGLPVTVTHFLDGPVGLAAACETALSLAQDGHALLACGLAPHAGLASLSPALLPHHRAPARVSATGMPGLGLPAEGPWS